MTKTTAKGKGESPTNSERMRKIGFRFTYSLNHSSDGIMRMIISRSVALTADLDKPLRDVAFAAAGTAGQRCTTLRRLFVHESDYDAFVPRLKHARVYVGIGNPLHTCTLIDPLIDSAAHRGMKQAPEAANTVGCIVRGGERLAMEGAAEVYYVRRSLVEVARRRDQSPSKTASGNPGAVHPEGKCQ